MEVEEILHPEPGTGKYLRTFEQGLLQGKINPGKGTLGFGVFYFLFRLEDQFVAVGAEEYTAKGAQGHPRSYVLRLAGLWCQTSETGGAGPEPMMGETRGLRGPEPMRSEAQQRLGCKPRTHEALSRGQGTQTVRAWMELGPENLWSWDSGPQAKGFSHTREPQPR